MCKSIQKLVLVLIIVTMVPCTMLNLMTEFQFYQVIFQTGEIPPLLNPNLCPSLFTEAPHPFT